MCLVALGADVNAASKPSSSFVCLLAGSFGALQLVCTTDKKVHGAHMLADYDRRTALHLAASEGHHKIVAYLLAHGAHHSLRDRWNNTPLANSLMNNVQTFPISYAMLL